MFVNKTPGAARLLVITIAAVALAASSRAQGLSTPGKAPAAPNISDAKLWLTPPPPIIGWLSFLGGIGLFFWNVHEYRTRQKQRKSDVASDIEGWWFETVLAPRTLDPLLICFAEYVSTVPFTSNGATPPAANVNAFLDQFLTDLAALGRELALLALVSRKTYSEVMAELDELEDQLTIYCYRLNKPVVAGIQSTERLLNAGARVAESRETCVALIKKMHGEMRMRDQ